MKLCAGDKCVFPARAAGLSARSVTSSSATVGVGPAAHRRARAAPKQKKVAWRPANGALASLELELCSLEFELSKAVRRTMGAQSPSSPPSARPPAVQSEALLLQMWGELVEEQRTPVQRLSTLLGGLASNLETGVTNADGEQVVVAALLVSVQLSFSFWYVLGKGALDSGVDPMAFALMRESFASAALWAAALKFEGGLRLQQPGDIGRFVILGALCTGNVAGFLKGLQYVPELQASIMQPFVPVLVMAVSAGMGIQQIGLRGKTGVVMSSSGAVLATIASCSGGLEGGMGGGDHQLLGSGILLAQICAYAAMMIYQRGLAGRYPPITLTAAYYSIASVMTAMLDVSAHHFNAGEIMTSLSAFGAPYDNALWGALAFAVVMATVYNYSAMTYCSSKVPANTVSVYNALQPLFSLMIGIGMFHHHLSIEEAGSGALIIGGLLLATSDNVEQAK